MIEALSCSESADSEGIEKIHEEECWQGRSIQILSHEDTISISITWEFQQTFRQGIPPYFCK